MVVIAVVVLLSVVAAGVGCCAGCGWLVVVMFGCCCCWFYEIQILVLWLLLSTLGCRWFWWLLMFQGQYQRDPRCTIIYFGFDAKYADM